MALFKSVADRDAQFRTLLEGIKAGIAAGTIADVDPFPEDIGKSLDPSYDPKHPEENCPHCGVNLERGDNGTCNRCGKPWTEKTAKSFPGLVLRLRKSFDEGSHPRADKGSAEGGQFVHRYKMMLRPPGTGTVPDVPYQYEPSAFEEYGFINTQEPLSVDDIHHYTLHEHPEHFGIISPGQRRIDKYVGVVEWTGTGVKVVDHPVSSRYPIGSEIRANADQFRNLAPDTDLNRRVYLHEEWRNEKSFKSFDEHQHPRAHAGETGKYHGGEFVPAHHAGGGLFGDDDPVVIRTTSPGNGDFGPLDRYEALPTHPLGPVVHDLHALYPQDGRVHEIPTGVIEPDYSQDRSRDEFSDSKISELAESMKRGLDQPIIVRPIVHPSGEPGFRVIAGERRYSAAKLLGWNNIRTQVRDVTDREAADIQLREYTARKDLNPMEEAKAFQSRITKFNMSPEEIAKIAGKSPAYVAGRVALNNLTSGWQTLMLDGSVRIGWGEMISKLSKPSQDAILFEANKWPEEKWTTNNIKIAVQERARAESQSAWDFDDDPIGQLTADESTAGGKVDKERTKRARDKAERLVSAMGKLLDEFADDDTGKLAPLAMAHKLGGWIDILERQRGALDEVISNAKAAKASRDTTGKFDRYIKTAGIRATGEEIQSRVSEKVGALANQITNSRRKLNRVEERLVGLKGKRGMDAERQKFTEEKKALLGKIAVLEDQKSKVRSVLKKAVDLTIAAEDRAETEARMRMFKSIQGIWLTRQWENALVPQEFAA